MNKTPKVSIVTICYNAEKQIESTITSVLDQSYENIEYLIIDGASKDSTLSIIKCYDTRIDCLVSEPDKNLYDAMNKGLARSTGEYILYMNAGDRFYQRDSLQSAMAGSKGADFIYSRAVYVETNGRQRPWHKKTPLPNKLNEKSFLQGMVICHHCMIVRRSLAPEYKIAPWRVSNDIEWSIRVMKRVRTKHFYDQTFCLYLEEGISDNQRFRALKERFHIAVLHFGLIPALLAQIKIVIGAIKRGRLS